MIYYSIKNKKEIVIFGHRGAPRLYPENSIDALVKSISLGSNGVEFDIQITADNQIILFHDDYIVSSQNKKHFIKKTNYSVICQLCKADKAPPPAHLDEVLNIIKNHTQVIFNIEIKSNSANNFKILKQVLSKIPKEALRNRCIISSFNPLLLFQLKLQFFYKGSTALILDSKKIKQWGGVFFSKIFILLLRPQFLHININYLNKELINWAHNHYISINTYTINDFQTLQKCISFKIDGVFTDNHHLYNANNNSRA